MQFLKISNAGKVDIAAYQKAGFSTKADDPTKIGEFGTGANFACIWAIRNDLVLKVFSGYREVLFGKTTGVFRGKEVEYLTVDGTETSFGIDLGKRTWQGWMAVREFWCNAIDETEAYWAVVEEADVQPEEDRTCIYLQINEEIQAVLDHWDQYFSNARKDVLFEGSGFKILQGGPELIVYRKGIRCFNYSVPSIFHYDLDNIDVSDSRVVENKYEMDNRIANILANHIPEELILQLCKQIKGSYEYNLNWEWYHVSFGDKWEKALKGSAVVEEEFKDEYKRSIESCPVPVYYLPRSLSKNITTNKEIEHVSGILATGDDGGEPAPLMEEQLHIIHSIAGELHESGYDDIKTILGYRPRNKSNISTQSAGIIYLNVEKIESNQNELKFHIIKQNERIKAGKPDNYENQLINTLLSKIENHAEVH